MMHATRQKDKILARIRRIKGQMDAVERSLEKEVPCADILRQLASIRGAMSGLTSEVMEGHLRQHILAAASETDRQQAAEEMIEVIQTYLK